MDSLTQIVLGAAVGEAILGKKVGNKAILWGAIAGTIPDLDVFVRFFVDHLRATEMHRSFSHSFIFSFIFSPILGWLASKIHKREGLNWKPWSKLMFGSLITHPLLDAHTNWGTQLFWPIDYKVAYNNIFIIDPLYTIPFLVFVIIAMRYKRDDPKRSWTNNMGLIISSAYMALTIVFKGIGYQYFVNSLHNQQIEYSEIITNPTPFNSILWVATVETKENYLVGYYSLLDGGKEVEFTKFKKNHELLGKMETEDITKRLIKLSEGWYVVIKEGEKTYFNDMRFGQMGISDDPDSFVFSHELWYEDGVLNVKQRQKPIEGIGKVFKDLINRVGGK
jgi:inner membrane protein